MVAPFKEDRRVGPRFALVFRAGDDDLATLPAVANTVERLVYNKERGPNDVERGRFTPTRSNIIADQYLKLIGNGFCIRLRLEPFVGGK